MCIIFVHHNNDATSKYKLIVAANRDEFMSRPTKPADFHAKYPEVLCGVDMEKGVEGGTWLGITKSGRFSGLTNFLVKQPDLSKMPRGELVIKYLTSNESPLAYMAEIQKQNYRACNLLAGKLDSAGKIEIGYYCTESSEAPRLLDEGNDVLACSHINCNWRKSTHGRKIFVDLVQNEGNAEPNALTETLFHSLLSDTTNLHPDEAISKVGSNILNTNAELMEKYCSIKIAGLSLYGTRMQTVILIDKDNSVHFTERSLSDSGQWTVKSYSYKIDL